MAEKHKPKPQLTEEDVIRLIDKRVGEVLETVAKEAEVRANRLAKYEVSDIIAKTAFGSFAEVLEDITDRLSEGRERE